MISAMEAEPVCTAPLPLVLPPALLGVAESEVAGLVVAGAVVGSTVAEVGLVAGATVVG